MRGDSEAGRLLLALDPDKYGSLSAGYATTEQEVEKVILRAYDSMKRPIGVMDDRMKGNLVKHGASGLKNSEFYRRSNIYKIFKQKGAFDFSLDEQMDQLIDGYKATMDPGLYQELKLALGNADQTIKKEKLRKIVTDVKYQGDEALQALLTHSVFSKMEKAAVQDGNILGVFVNRSMVVGSTLNQFDDYMMEIEKIAGVSSELKKIIGTEIGLVAAETAIDTSINYSTSKFRATMRDSRDKMQDVAKFISQAISAGGDTNAINQAALEALGLSGDIDIDLIGETAVKRLGLRIGAGSALMYSQEFGGQFDTSLRPTIDRILLEDRLSDSDITELFDSIRKGVQDARSVQALTGAELDALEKELQNIPDSLTERRAALSRLFSVSEGPYASMSLQDARGAADSASFELMRRLGLSGMPEDHILAATNVTEEARKIADVLLDRHKEGYENVTKYLTDEMAEYEKIFLEERRERLGQKIYEDIHGAHQITGLSKEELITAVDKVAAERAALTRQRQLDLSRLLYGDDENFAGQITMARVRRRAAALQARAGDLEQTVLDDILSSKISGIGQTDETTVQKILNDYFNNVISKGGSQEEMQLAQAALGKTIEAATEEEAENARRRANVITVQTKKAALEQDQATSQAVSKTGKTTFAGDENLRSAINAALNDEDYTKFLGAKGKYVRFSEYLKSGQLKNLFKNNNLFRNSIYATGALIVGSFAYQGFKDHTPEKMQGPPMLPGGSAYESQYPNRASEIPQIGTVSYNPGVSYKVNLYGNRNQVQQFQDMAMGLGNFDMDTTMYSGIPQVGTDPYQQLASSY